MPLNWRDADKTSRRDLNQFTCAFPPRAERRHAFQRSLEHPRPYQLRVQSHIRNLRPPVDDNPLLLGYDGEGLAAVCEYRLHPDGDAIPGHFIKTLARANRLHGSDVASQILEEVLQRMRHARTHGWVLCRIDQDNRASRAFFREHGFEIVRHDGSPQLWGREIDLSVVETVDVPATFAPVNVENE